MIQLVYCPVTTDPEHATALVIGAGPHVGANCSHFHDDGAGGLNEIAGVLVPNVPEDHPNTYPHQVSDGSSVADLAAFHAFLITTYGP